MQQWYLDSGCSKHMTGDKSKFLSISFKQEGHITYGDNNKGRIVGRGSIGDKDILVIHDVLYVEGLKHNLLSIRSIVCKISSKSEGVTLQSCKENSEISQRNINCWVMVSFSLSHSFNWLLRF